MYKQALFLAGMAALPLSCHAQSFIGLSASTLTNTPFASYSSPNLYGGAISGGVQLTPHTALQLEVGYNGRTTTSDLSYYLYTEEIRTRVLTMPLLLRYTFTNPEKSFHLDGLAGFTYYHSAVHYTETLYRLPPSPQTSEFDGSSNQFCVALGPSARYALTPQVEIFTAGVVSAVLNDSYNTFSDRLFLNAQLGAHYTFGQR